MRHKRACDVKWETRTVADPEMIQGGGLIKIYGIMNLFIFNKVVYRALLEPETLMSKKKNSLHTARMPYLLLQNLVMKSQFWTSITACNILKVFKYITVWYARIFSEFSKNY